MVLQKTNTGADYLLTDKRFCLITFSMSIEVLYAHVCKVPLSLLDIIRKCSEKAITSSYVSVANYQWVLRMIET